MELPITDTVGRGTDLRGSVRGIYGAPRTNGSGQAKASLAACVAGVLGNGEIDAMRLMPT
jgi:hypothetical protein